MLHKLWGVEGMRRLNSLTLYINECKNYLGTEKQFHTIEKKTKRDLLNSLSFFFKNSQSPKSHNTAHVLMQLNYLFLVNRLVWFEKIINSYLQFSSTSQQNNLKN